MGRKLPRVEGRSKRQKYFTLLLIPNNENTLRKWRIPVVLVPVMTLLSIVGLGAICFFAYGYFAFQGEVEALKILRNINASQAEQIRELERQATTLQNKLLALDELDQKVRTLVGLDPVETGEGDGRGGSLEPLVWENEGLTLHSEVMDIRRQDLERRQTMTSTSRFQGNSPEDGLQLVRKVAENYEELQEQMEKKAIKLEQLLSEVEERLAYLATVPDLWPVEGRVTSEFGWRRNPITKRGNEFHEGIDIAARPGTPVKAAADGKVVFAGYRSGWGRVLLIDHGNGYQTQYAHNSSLLVKAGEQVKKGQIVARVGNTGRSTGAHLDFRIIKNGEAIDPRLLLEDDI